MKEYHKIQTVWDRDPGTKMKTLIDGAWSKPEFELLKNLEWMWSEKIDGTNIRIWWENGEPRFGGRTERAQIPAQLIAKLQDLFRDRRGLGHLTLYGEGYGAKIQKVGSDYNPDGVDFCLFDAWTGLRWLPRAEMIEIAAALEVNYSWLVDSGTLEDAIARCREGFASGFGTAKAEGIVARPSIELLNGKGERIITKIKCKDFQ